MIKPAKKSFLLSIALLILYSISRLPILSSELTPFLFCDEQIFLNDVHSLITKKRYVYAVYTAGGMNIIPLFILGKLLYYFNIYSQSNLLFLGRFFYLFLLGIFTCLYLYKLTKAISNKSIIGFISVIVFIVSPYCISQSKIWYPDDYIYLFSTIFLFYVVKYIQTKKTKYLFVITLSLVLACSVKYTAFLLFSLLPFIFLKEDNLIEATKKYFFMGFFFILGFLCCNYALLIHPLGWIDAFQWNIKNYQPHEWSRISGPIYYFFLTYITFLTPVHFISYCAGYRDLFTKNRELFFIFLIFPIFYIYFMGTANFVLNRNVSILIPFVIPILSIGIYQISLFLINNKKNFILLFFYLPPLLFFIFITYSDFGIDSRYIAYEWLKKNVKANESIITNESCSVPTFGDKFFNGPTSELVEDFFIINSYWFSGENLPERGRGLLQIINQKNLHFYNFNDASLYKPIHHRDYNVGDIFFEKYILVKKINKNGPGIYIFKKNITE